MRKRVARYDEVADFYETFAPDSVRDPAIDALLTLLGEVKGARVLDLGCGHGRLSRELAHRGAAVVGIDISSALIDKAREREGREPLGVVYVHGDVCDQAALRGERFDTVACSVALGDIDDLDAALATVGRVLRPGGMFAFSMLHPCFPGSEARGAEPAWDPRLGYFTEGWRLTQGPAHGLRPRVGITHRLLSTYLNALIGRGFVIEVVCEPDPHAGGSAGVPASERVPVYFVARCRAPTAQLGDAAAHAAVASPAQVQVGGGGRGG